MISRLVTRHGGNRYVSFPEHTPEVFSTYKWPQPIADALEHADSTYLAMTEAEVDWEDAHDLFHVVGPQRDRDALLAALRAGKGDPGEVHTDGARRAEEVAWAKFEIAREDAATAAREAKELISAYLTDHEPDIAAHEIHVMDMADEAAREAADAQTRATTARRLVGTLYVAVKQHVEGAFAGDNWMRGTTPGKHDAGDTFLREQYEQLAGIEPTPLDPGVVQPAGTLTKF